MFYTRYLKTSKWMCDRCEHVTNEPWRHRHFLRAYSWHRVMGVVLD
jgi:hypothetical protein